MRRIVPFACVLLLASVPANGALPLSVDDAGTVDPAHGVGGSARLGLSRSLDSGLAVAWFGAGEGDSGCEFVVDLKFAPGDSAGWRPRPFLRSDVVVLTASGQAQATFAWALWRAHLGARVDRVHDGSLLVWPASDS